MAVIGSAKKTMEVKTAVGHEQVQHFILLINILNKAGLDLEEVQACLRKYLSSLKPEQRTGLTANLPNVVENIGQLDLPYVAAIARLSEDKMTVEDVANVANRAKLRFVDVPSLGHGEKGWLRNLLHALARDASSQHPGAQDTAWFVAPDCAIWLAIMSRFRIILSDEEWHLHLSDSLRRAYRDGWLGVFGLRRAAAPFDTTTPAADSGTAKANTGPRDPRPAAGMDTHVLLPTRHFFSLQVHNPQYLSLVAEITAVVRKRSNALHRGLRLPQLGGEDRGGSAKGKGRGPRGSRGRKVG
jgi:hypothetical protein